MDTSLWRLMYSCPNIHYMLLSPHSLDRSTWVGFKLNGVCRYAWVRETAWGRERESNRCLVKSLLKFLLHYTRAFAQTHAWVTLRHKFADTRVVYLYFHVNKCSALACQQTWVCCFLILECQETEGSCSSTSDTLLANSSVSTSHLPGSISGLLFHVAD